MSITDELREWKGNINTRLQPETVLALRSELNRIADRIDAEHESAMYNMRREHDEWVASRDAKWVKLPLDANGVPIRVGDVLTDGEHTFVVDELATFGNGSWSIRSEGEGAWKACDVTHHHKPTVEDVLREFAEKMAENTAMYVAESWDANERDEADAAAIAEYAAKLRLVEEGE